MKEANIQKNTLLKNAKANAQSNLFRRVFFYPNQGNFANAFINSIIFAAHGPCA
jgi:hypothetical protein